MLMWYIVWWYSQFSFTWRKFEGALQKGSKVTLTQTLDVELEQIQAINSWFLSDQPKHTKTCGICFTFLRKVYFHTVGLIESILPFYKMMTWAGLSPNEGRDKKVCTHVKTAYTRRIHEVRTVSAYWSFGSMIYDMFQATQLIHACIDLDWIGHPDVPSAMAELPSRIRRRRANGCPQWCLIWEEIKMEAVRESKSKLVLNY